MDNRPCAACTHGRVKCPPDCPLIPYFPKHQLQEFLQVHKIFGLKNVLKRLRDCKSQFEKDESMESMKIEAENRRLYPTLGSLHDIRNCITEIVCEQEELKHTLCKLKFFKDLEKDLKECPEDDFGYLLAKSSCSGLLEEDEMGSSNACSSSDFEMVSELSSPSTFMSLNQKRDDSRETSSEVDSMDVEYKDGEGQEEFEVSGSSGVFDLFE